MFVKILLPAQPGKAASPSSFSLSPSSQTVAKGASFTVAINLATAGNNVDTVQIGLNYPSSLLGCASIANGSSFTVVPQADTCSGGNILLQRGRTGGFNTDTTVATITFSALASGTAAVSFNGSTVAYSAGNAVTTTTSGGSYTVSAPAPAPTPAPAPATKSPAKSSSTPKTVPKSSPAPPSSPTPPPAAAASVPLAITNLKVSNVTEKSATVTWDTNKASNSSVGFSMDTSYKLTATGTADVTSHSVKLDPALLAAGATYYVQATSTTPAGEHASQTTSFKTGGVTAILHITDKNGHALSGASVKLGAVTVKTNGQGTATFKSVGQGKQTVTVTSSGGSSTSSIVVGGAISQNFTIATKLTSASSPLTYVVIFVAIMVIAAAGWTFWLRPKTPPPPSGGNVATMTMPDPAHVSPVTPPDNAVQNALNDENFPPPPMPGSSVDPPAK
jgi:hypothetical protein